MFTGRRAHELKVWLEGQAEEARSNEDLARPFAEECRRTQMILPAVSSIERLCADVLVKAERRIETRIVGRLNEDLQARLDALLAEDVEGRLSRFIHCPSGHACMPERVVAPIRGRQELCRHQPPSGSFGNSTTARTSFRPFRRRAASSDHPPASPGRALLHRLSEGHYQRQSVNLPTFSMVY